MQWHRSLASGLSRAINNPFNSNDFITSSTCFTLEYEYTFPWHMSWLTSCTAVINSNKSRNQWFDFSKSHIPAALMGNCFGYCLKEIVHCASNLCSNLRLQTSRYLINFWLQWYRQCAHLYWLLWFLVLYIGFGKIHIVWRLLFFSLPKGLMKFYILLNFLLCTTYYYPLIHSTWCFSKVIRLCVFVCTVQFLPFLGGLCHITPWCFLTCLYSNILLSS